VIPVRDRDIVVMGSDGLFDNLYPEDILKCLNRQQKTPNLEVLNSRSCTLLSPKLASRCLAKKAYHHSRAKDYLSPFAKASIQANEKQMGGKEDDISVIVA